MMKFKVRDLLLLTLIAGLVMVSWQRNQELNQIRSQQMQVSAELMQVRNEANQIRRNYRRLQPAWSQAQNIREIYRETREGFEAVVNKYCELKPVPKHVVFRNLPWVPNSQSLVDSGASWIISIPDEYPVYLRFAATRHPIRNSKQLDDQVWNSDVPLSDCGPYQQRIEPGISRVTFRLVQETTEYFEIQLNDQPIFRTQLTRDESSFWTKGPGRQSLIKRRLGNQTLRLHEFGTIHQNQPIGLIVWLSNDTQTGRFDKFPIPQDESVQENETPGEPAAVNR